MPKQNYVLGRGRVLLANVDPVSKEPGQYRYVGITRELNVTATTEELEHTSSDEGINQIDDRVQLSVTRTGTIVFEDIEMDNIALFFFGQATTATQQAANTQTDAIAGSRLTRILEDGWDADNELIIGATAANPLGARAVSSDPTLAGLNSSNTPQSVTLVKNTDWEVVDNARGAIRILNTNKTFGASSDAVLSRITITYNRAAIGGGVKQVTSGSSPFEGALRFEEKNPVGQNKIWAMPLVNISPNGDMALKAEEWVQIPLSMAINKPATAEAIYSVEVPK